MKWLAAFAAVILAWAAQPSFDVASIRPSAASRIMAEGGRRERIAFSPTSLTMENATLSDCIQWAYDVRFYQISGPAWLTEDRYDILAKTAVPAGRAQLRVMLQSMLADRFKLALDSATKMFPVYELTRAKNGVRLRQAMASSSAPSPGQMQVVGEDFVFRHITMAELADRLSDFAAINRPVLDRTGLAGSFDFALTSAARRTRDPDPSLFIAAIERLGLRLESRKVALEVLVVNHAERPSPN